MTRTGSADAREEVLAEAYESARVPGVVAATFRRGQIDWRGSYGDTACAYRIGSITKTFTAAAVLQLRDDARLQLDDPIGRHVADAPYADHTIRHLLCHASGMTAEPAGSWWERIPGGRWKDLKAANADPIDVFRAAERHHYSNLAYGLLGELVARLRETTWWNAIRTGLIEPLGLVSTTYDAGADAATGTSRNPLTGLLVREPSEDAGAMAPAGQLWSTVEDLARWADFLVAGRPGVLSRETLVEMRTVQAGDPDLQHRGAYGLGLRLRWTPTGTLVGHTGAMPGFLAGLFVNPTTRAGAGLLTNATTGIDPEQLVGDLCEAALQQTGGDAPQVMAPEADRSSPAAALAGPWYWGNTTMELVPTPAGFVLVEGAVSRRFTRATDDGYRGDNGYFAGERLVVHRRADGTAGHLEVATFVFTRTPYDPAAPIPGGPPVPLDPT